MSLELFEYPLVSVAVRSFLLLAITLTVTVLLRRKSAAIGHHVWLLGFLGCLLIPIVMLCIPNVAVPVLPPVAAHEIENHEPLNLTRRPINHGQVVRQPEIFATPIPAAIHETASKAGNAQPHVEPAMSTPAKTAETTPTIRSEAKSAVAVGAASISWPTWRMWLMLVWATGAAVCGVRLLWQVHLVRRAARACPALEFETWRNLCDEVAQELRVRQPISLRTHREAVTPMVVGFWRPLVLVPSDASNWSPEQQRHVLLHELAHVQRRDVLAQLVAGAACVLYWFNPLAWWGAAQMRRLREVACDDVVVRHAQRPSTYAQTLLDVARQYRCQQQVFSVAMARNTQVESRIRSILDATRERATLTKRNARVVGIAAVAILFVVGTLQLTSRAQEQAEASTSAQKASETQQTDKGTAEAAEKDAEKQEARKQDDPGKLRKLTVRVRDESDHPIADARVTASVWNVDPNDERYPTRDYRTNAAGEVTVEIPERLRILRLWSSKGKHVPLFVNFAEGSHDDGLLIPDKFEFRMPAGQRLSGLVVDGAGQPIANANVQVMVDVNDRFAGPNPTAEISTWLANGTSAVRTNKEGRWEILNAPAPRAGSDYNFRIMVTHRDFAGDCQLGRAAR